MNRKHLATRYRITDGKDFRLKDYSPDDTWKLKSKEDAHKWLEEGLARLSDLQDRLYAQNQWSLLLVFQAMDAAGKDSTIKHVMSGTNPQGCQVYSFKVPSEEELNHNFLWRTAKVTPERGRIGIFNRSYYEETLVVRVHPELLAHEKLPSRLITKNIWEERFEDIAAFEQHLARSGVVIRKFYLNVSKEEQRRRFLSRLEEPAKNWKFSTGDLQERAHWDEYMKAYQQVVRHTATEHAPWYIVPADHKWFTRLVVAEVILETLESLDLHYPKVDKAKRKELAAVRLALLKKEAKV